MEPKNTLPVAHHANDANPPTPQAVIPGLTRDPVFEMSAQTQPPDHSSASHLAVIPGTRSVTRDPVFEMSDQTQPPDKQRGVYDDKRLDPGSATPLRGDPGVRDDTAAETGVRDDHSAASFEKARSVVAQLAQLRIDYRDWIRAGMALYAGLGESGKELWDLFLGNPHYPQETQKDLDHHWRSFRNVHTLTLATLFYLGERYGCV